jgi:pyruvate kinase
MLSEESALGDHPVAAVSMMTAVSKEVENDHRFLKVRNHVLNTGNKEFDVVSKSAVSMAEAVDAKAIVALSDTGDIVRGMSALKPSVSIYCATSNPTVGAQILLSFGAYELPLVSKEGATILKEIKAFLAKNKIAGKGDDIVIVDERVLSISIVTI